MLYRAPNPAPAAPGIATPCACGPYHGSPSCVCFRRCGGFCPRKCCTDSGKSVHYTAPPPMYYIAAFLYRLAQHNLKLPSAKGRIGATDVVFLGHYISPDGLRPNLAQESALAEIPMARDIGELLRSLFGGLSYYRKLLPNLAKRVQQLPGARSWVNSPTTWRSSFADFSKNLARPGSLCFLNGMWLTQVLFVL